MNHPPTAHPWRANQTPTTSRRQRRRGPVDDWESSLLADVTRVYEATRAEESE